MDKNTDRIINTNIAFWNQEEVSRPPISFRCGSTLPYSMFACTKHLQNRDNISPEDVVPEDFLPDYQRMIEEHKQIHHLHTLV